MAFKKEAIDFACLITSYLAVEGLVRYLCLP